MLQKKVLICAYQYVDGRSIGAIQFSIVFPPNESQNHRQLIDQHDDRATAGKALDSVREHRVLEPFLFPNPEGHQAMRSEEHTSELQSQSNLVCRLLLEKKKKDRSKADLGLEVLHRTAP